jgi:molybdenum cofactor cytidylyltransferase
MLPTRPNANRHVVVILAAGYSCKAGQPLVRHVAQLALHTQPCRVLLVVNPMLAVQIQALVHDLPVECVINPYAEQGMTSSLQMAAHTLSADQLTSQSTDQRTDYGTDQRHVMVLAVDQPLLQVEHLIQLIAAVQGQPTQVALTGYAGVMGLPVLVPMSVFTQIKQLPSDQDVGLKPLLLQYPAALKTVVKQPHLQHDLDTPAMLQAAIEQGWIDRTD